MQFFKTLFLPITAPISFIQNHFKATLLVLILVYAYQNTNEVTLEKTNLQTIRLSGPIMDASEIVEEINTAKNNKDIKGVLLIVNSPGGAVAPSVEIAYAIKELNSVKPVVTYASGVIASGSYYASIWSKHIVANPGSMVGSIGVIMQSFNAQELLSKIGIKPQTVKIGTYKEAGTPARLWTQEERAELNKVIKSTYDMFVNDVASARNLKVENHKDYADAHIFTASQAKEVGLIDTVATISKAKQLIINYSKVKKPIWSKKDKMDKLLEKLASVNFNNLGLKFNQLLAF